MITLDSEVLKDPPTFHPQTLSILLSLISFYLINKVNHFIDLVKRDQSPSSHRLYTAVSLTFKRRNRGCLMSKNPDFCDFLANLASNPFIQWI